MYIYTYSLLHQQPMLNDLPVPALYVCHCYTNSPCMLNHYCKDPSVPSVPFFYLCLTPKTSPIFKTQGLLREYNTLFYRMMTSYIKGPGRVVNHVPTLRLGQVR